MDATVAKLLEILQHLLRDFLGYIIPGSVVIFYFIYLVNRFEFEVSVNSFFEIKYFEVIYIILSYIIGQFLMGIMYVVIEPGIEGWITKRMSVEVNLSTEKEIAVFVKNRKAYDYFIERSNQLYYLRWNLAGAFLITTVLHILSMILSHFTSFIIQWWYDVSIVLVDYPLNIITLRHDLQLHYI